MNSTKVYRMSSAGVAARKRYLKSDARKRELKRYRKRHAVKRREQNKQWRQLHPANEIETSRIRRAGLKTSIPKWYEKKLIANLYQMRDKLNMQWNLKGKERFVVDHIIPIKPKDNSVCGLHCFDNLQLLSISQNSMKNDAYTVDW